jgi:hypothetical protein
VNVRQLSVFIENKAGRVSEITDQLGSAGVNIRGFSVSDTADYGIGRLVVAELVGEGDEGSRLDDRDVVDFRISIIAEKNTID